MGAGSAIERAKPIRGPGGGARRPKPCRLALSRRLQRIVAKKLSLEWSPEQISGWLKRSYPEDEEMQISHETIYRSLFVQARGVLKKELVGHLRTRRMMRRSKKGQHTRSAARADCRRGFHPRSACRDRGPRSPGPLGGRPPGRLEQHAHCDAGRAEVALHDAGEGRRQGHGERRPGTEETGSAAACRAPEIADLGPRDGDGGAQEVCDCHGRPGLLLRSAKPMATGKRMRTPIASYVSTSRRALICRIGHKRIWAALPLD